MKNGSNRSRIAALAAVSLFAALASQASAGSVFLTGHDPDFHALLGGNSAGAARINNVAINYIMDPAFNTFVAGGATKFLFVESRISPPGGHVNGVNGIIASGYTPGVNFDHVDASGLNAALNQLGTTYGGLVIASDFGGVLTQAELDILNARAADIATFVNNNGGLYAMAEGNSGAGLTPNGGWYAYVPQVTVSSAFNQSETGITTTAFGQSLGLTNGDVNGNASHSIFTRFQSLQVVDVDQFGQVLSVAGRTSIPAPSTLAMLGLAGLTLRRRRA